MFMPFQLADYNTENQAAASRLIEAVESVGITASLEIQAVNTDLCIALIENTLQQNSIALLQVRLGDRQDLSTPQDVLQADRDIFFSIL